MKLRKWLSIVCLWLHHLRRMVKNRLRISLAVLCKCMEKMKLFLEETKTKCLDILRPWWDTARSKMEEQRRKWLDPAGPWLDEQCTKLETELQKGKTTVSPWLEERNGRVRGFVGSNKDQLFRASIFLNVFLLLLRVTSLQMGYVANYVAVASQNQMNVTSMRGSAVSFELPPPLPDIPRDLSSPLSDVMHGGCLTWTGPPKNTQAIREAPPPTGIVASVLLGREQLDYVCGYFPTQLEHFIFPQGLDILFVLPRDSGEDHVTKQELLECLNLSHQLPKSEKSWMNLDSTTLLTVEYSYDFMLPRKSTRKAPSIFVAETTIELPQYLQEDMSIADSPVPRSCSTSISHVQGTRWYTNEFLNLSILQEYEYFVKLDTDVVFKKPLPLNLLHDMKVRGAVFGHSAVFPDSIQMPCGDDIVPAVRNFELGWQAHSGEQGPNVWQGTVCSGDHPRIEVNTGAHYYSNLVVGRVDHFQRNEVRVLGQYLTHTAGGFFKHRWTDQIFWHFALGLFIGGPDNNYETSGLVADYTDFRCAPLKNCWLSFFDSKQFPLESDQCRNDGVFAHSRSLEYHRKEWSQVDLPSAETAKRYSKPYESTYHHDCPPDL